MLARVPSTLLALAAVLAVSGCGSDDPSSEGGSAAASAATSPASSEPTTPAASPSIQSGAPAKSGGRLARAALASKADAICTKSKTDALAVPQPADFTTDAASASRYLAKVQTITRRQVNEMRALKPDAKATADYTAMVSAQDGLADLLDSVTAKVKGGDVGALAALAGGAKYNKPFLAASARIGAKACAAG